MDKKLRKRKGNTRTEKKGHYKKPTGREKGPAQTLSRKELADEKIRKATVKAQVTTGSSVQKPALKPPPKSPPRPQRPNWNRPPLPKKDDPMFGITRLDPFRVLLSVENPRSDARSPKEKKGLAELAASILEHDIIEPLVITPIEFVPPHIVAASIEYTNDVFKEIGQKNPIYTHMVMAGERRLQATMSLILEYMDKHGDTVPCSVRVFSSESSRLAIMFAENMHRSDVNSMDRARHLMKIFEAMKAEDPNVKQVDLSVVTGIDQSQISTLFRLLALPEDIQKRVYDRAISPVMANQLMQVDGRTRAKFLRLMDKGGASASQITMRIKVVKAEKDRKKQEKSGNHFTRPVGRMPEGADAPQPWKKRRKNCICVGCHEEYCRCHPYNPYQKKKK